MRNMGTFGAFQTLYRLAFYVCLASLIALSASAQDGLQATLTASQELRATDRENFNANADDGLRSITRLSFGLESVTRTQQFALNLSSGLALNFDSPNAQFGELEDPEVRLSYSTEARNARFSVGTTLQKVSLDDASFFDDVLNDFIVSENGDRTAFTLDTQLELGTNSPLQFQIDHRYARSEFTGTTDPSLTDSTVNALDLRVNLDRTTALSANAFASYFQRETENGTDRTEVAAGVGLTVELSESTRVSGSLAFREVETTTRQRGPDWSIGIERDVPTGRYGLDLSHRQSAGGNRQRFVVARNLDLKRGSARLALGATRVTGFSARPLVEASVQSQISETRQIQFDASQSITLDNNNQDTLRTQAAFQYLQDLTSLSSLSANVRYAKADVLDASGSDQTSVSVALSHNYAVGGDWQLISGYSVSSNRTVGSADQKTKSLFFRLERTFDFLP